MMDKQYADYAADSNRVSDAHEGGEAARKGRLALTIIILLFLVLCAWCGHAWVSHCSLLRLSRRMD